MKCIEPPDDLFLQSYHILLKLWLVMRNNHLNLIVFHDYLGENKYLRHNE